MSDTATQRDILTELRSLFRSSEFRHASVRAPGVDTSSTLLSGLQRLLNEGHATLKYSTIPRVTFDGRCYVEGEYLRHMRGLVHRCRTNTELQHHLWSAYAYLQHLFPHEKLAVSRDAPPFLYLEPRRGVAMTAGSVCVKSVLTEAVRRPFSKLGIVAEAGRWTRPPQVSRCPKPMMCRQTRTASVTLPC
ncbi:hypothetical protein B0G77_4503 [Paraburkholderia sp. BL10I2N1]|nr:hypothetical protein B0G77_4503 [Paraburkholderia sp. BL10I2N1]